MVKTGAIANRLKLRPTLKHLKFPVLGKDDCNIYSYLSVNLITWL